MRNWYLATSAFLLTVLANRWVVRPLRAAGVDYVVKEVRRESRSDTTVVLRPRHRWHRGLRFQAGQFAWMSIRGRPWDEHPFSIASSAERPSRLEFTIRNVGHFTSGVENLSPGTRVRLDGPHGAFTVPATASRPVLLIAAGVGITPMMSILRTMTHRGEAPPCLLVVGARHEDELLFRDELAELRADPGIAVMEVLSAPPADWTGLTGRIDGRLLAQLLPGQRASRLTGLYVCGPPGLVTEVRSAAAELGVPLDRIHSEQFDMV